LVKPITQELKVLLCWSLEQFLKLLLETALCVFEHPEVVPEVLDLAILQDDIVSESFELIAADGVHHLLLKLLNVVLDDG
jgi:hypothetical protein